MAGPQLESLESVPEAIRQLQRSSLYTVPVVIVGLVATLIAAAIGAYYVFHVSSKIADTQQQLAKTQGALVATQVNLGVAKTALQKAQPANPGKAHDVSTALANVETSEKTLRSASSSLEQATIKLPSPVAPTGPNTWMTVVGSYVSLDGATKKANEVVGGGTCAEVWRSDEPAYNVVVIGPPSDQDAALQRAALARKNGIASDAFVKSGAQWTPLVRFPNCAKAAPSH
jgi:hypothetical protein